MVGWPLLEEAENEGLSSTLAHVVVGEPRAGGGSGSGGVPSGAVVRHGREGRRPGATGEGVR